MPSPLQDWLGLISTSPPNPMPGDMIMRSVAGGWTTFNPGISGSVMTIDPSSGLPNWLPNTALSTVFPEAYGAVGDGVADDTAALTAWAATGETLALTPGKTYKHQRGVFLTRPGQKLEGNGATLLRAPQAVTTTATAITGGITNQIVVAALSGGSGATAWSFEVGDDIVVESGGYFDPEVRTIQSINVATKTITVSTMFGSNGGFVDNIHAAVNSLSGTINVRHGYVQVAMDSTDQSVRNVIIDGNLAHWSWGRWQHTIGVAAGGCDGGTVEHCHIRNQYGDGFSPVIHTSFTFTRNIIENVMGRGVSLAGINPGDSTGARITFNRIYNCDQDALVSGSDGYGNIQVSAGGKDAVILGNELDTGLVGVGSINDPGNSDMTIAANVIRNMSQNSIDGASSLTGFASNMLIEGNRIYNCGPLEIDNAGQSNSGPARWQVKNNLFFESTVNVSPADTLGIVGNHFYSAGTALTFITVGGAPGAVVRMIVGHNQFVGGKKAVSLVGNSNIDIVDNVMSGQTSRAVDGSGGYTTEGRITGNRIIAPAAQDAGGWIGIHLSSATASFRVAGNRVDMSPLVGGAFSVGINVGGGSDNTIESNRVIGGSIGRPINDTATRTRCFNNRVDPINGGIFKGGTSCTYYGNVMSNGALTGTATLVAGTVTVNTVEIQTGDIVILSRQAAGGTLGQLSVGTITNGTSFVINSSNAADTSTVYWEIRH